jgi:SOS-response transcriptional repressor LexA
MALRPELSNDNFKGWLLAARERAGLTQEQLGDLVGADRATVSRWERGEMLPRERKRAMIARQLGFSPLLEELDRVSETTVEYTREGAPPAKLPLYFLGHIAGTTDTGGVDLGEVQVTPWMAEAADAAFVLHGTSMEPMFQNGDVVGVRKALEARAGQYVVVRIEGELTFKRYDGVREGQGVFSPLNPDHGEILAREFEIVGIYRWMVRGPEMGRI